MSSNGAAEEAAAAAAAPVAEAPGSDKVRASNKKERMRCRALATLAPASVGRRPLCV
jgi:hypothetical protein